MSNIFGRQVIVLLTNKSGGGVIAGDVVVSDGSNDSAFTTTTSASSVLPVWVVQETIASNATGRVLIEGYAALVNVNASVTRGHYGVTHTVAKQATDGGASRTSGTFCRFLTGGTTPIAYVYPTDLSGAALTNPMTTKGDIIVADTGGTPTALAVGSTSGHVLTSNGSAAFPSYQAVPASGGAAAAFAQGSGSADYSTGSTSFADVDSTNLSITTTNAQSGDLLLLLADCEAGDGGGNVALGFSVAGTDVGDTLGLSFFAATATTQKLAFHWIHTMASGTQVTIRLRWKTGSGTANMYNRSAVVRPHMVVINLSRAGTL